jgi:integrase
VASVRSRQRAPSSKVRTLSDKQLFQLDLNWTDDNGIRRRTRHEYPSESAARKAEAQAHRRIENGLPPFPEKREEPWTVAEVLGFYHDHHVLDARPRSQIRMKQHRDELERFIGSSQAERVSYDDLIQFRQWRREEAKRMKKRQPKDVTTKKDLSHLRAALRYAKVNGKIQSHIFERLARDMRENLFPSENESKGQVIEDAKFDEILSHMGEQYQKPLRLARLTGMRRGEVCFLAWENVRQDRLSITVSKTGHRDIALTDEMKALLPPRSIRGGFVFTAPGGGDLYQSLSAAWDRARRKAHVPTARIHDLRHTCATEMEEAVGRTEMAIALGMSPTTAARYGGHRKLERGRAAFAKIAEIRRYSGTGSSRPASK